MGLEEECLDDVVRFVGRNAITAMKKGKEVASAIVWFSSTAGLYTGITVALNTFVGRGRCMGQWETDLHSNDWAYIGVLSLATPFVLGAGVAAGIAVFEYMAKKGPEWEKKYHYRFRKRY